MARIALVTGGTRGIGAAISVGLKNAGRHVIATYAGNEAAAASFSKETGIETVRFDAGDYDQCATAVAAVAANHGPVEILVNNAGITRDTTIAKMSRDMWDAVIDTNLGSCFNLSKSCFDGMRAGKFGRIVNIGSINGQAGQYGQVNYAAAKSGIHGFTKALAQEGARFGITVNAIAPGYVDTEMV
ncbi:MAG TPA: SDR family NAD(P)-dependent oxidoreductase, partial [Acetobacteraceae bacterium]|nr:SDR family NAD(P)-dependent oxidoreductase [Acetobacteraceae bacterium]